MSTNSTSSGILSKCAACGKGGDNLKVCTSCEQVSYCNAKCRNSHRSKHKKACKQYAAKIRDKNASIRAEVDAISEKMCSIEISDEELFADLPPKEDCEICMLPMPHSSVACCGVRTNYQRCCGKTICSGCVMASVEGMKEGNLKRWCPYCRAPIDITDEGFMRQIKKRMALNDGEAFSQMGLAYYNGDRGLPQDHGKAFDFFNRGAELGSIRAHYTLAMSYEHGVFIEKDMGKAINHYKSAAIRGHEGARYNLGIIEEQKGSFVQAFKHFMMAARSGDEDSLKKVGEGYKAGRVTKDEYTSTLRAHKVTRDEMKSEQRTKAWEMMAKRDSSLQSS